MSALKARMAQRLPLALVFVLVVGCGESGDTIVRARRPAGTRPDVDQAMAARGALLIPADAPFNVTFFESDRSGEAGSATGDASLRADGASCRAEAAGGASAWGKFQLGYCFDNMSGVPLDARVRIRLALTESTTTENEDPGSAGTSATSRTSLVFFIKDATTGLDLKNEALLQTSLQRGGDSRSTKHDVVFDARFEPGHGYYLIVDGRTEAKAGESRAAACALDVTEYSIEIVWSRATATADG